jgi:site-specific DNA recombinase
LSDLTLSQVRAARALLAWSQQDLAKVAQVDALMEQLLDRRQEWADQRRTHISEHRKRAAEAEAKLNRLYQTQTDSERISSSVERLAPTITADSLHRFAMAARRKLRDRECGYRRDHLRALTQRVEVDSNTEAFIIGSRTGLLRALASSDSGDSAAVCGVLGFKPKWRARNDSNVRPSDS